MTDVVVRRCRPADVPALAALRRTWSEEAAAVELADDGFEDAFAEWFEREQQHRLVWLAQRDGEPVGMLNMLVFTRMPKPRVDGSERSGRWGYVANVFVLERFRDGGIGRALLDEAIAYADAAGFARLVLRPRDRSIPFYERAGFGPATSLMARHRPDDSPSA